MVQPQTNNPRVRVPRQPYWDVSDTDWLTDISVLGLLRRRRRPLTDEAEPASYRRGPPPPAPGARAASIRPANSR